jgi:putative oxidoreductase
MSSIVALVGRALMCAIFVESGLAKLLSPAATIGYMAHLGLPLPPAAYAVSVVVEFGGGLAILLGFQIRIVAAIMAVFCIATALIAHNDMADRMQEINFMKNLCMAGGFLQLVAWGGGRYTVSRN